MRRLEYHMLLIASITNLSECAARAFLEVHHVRFDNSATRNIRTSICKDETIDRQIDPMTAGVSCEELKF